MAERNILYDEDIEEVADAIGLMTKHSSLDRLDIKLRNSNMSAVIYWAGTVLRVDIKGVDRE